MAAPYGQRGHRSPPLPPRIPFQTLLSFPLTRHDEFRRARESDLSRITKSLASIRPNAIRGREIVESAMVLMFI